MEFILGIIILAFIIYLCMIPGRIVDQILSKDDDEEDKEREKRSD